jgi:hypothetical protein
VTLLLLDSGGDSRDVDSGGHSRDKEKDYDDS